MCSSPIDLLTVSFQMKGARIALAERGAAAWRRGGEEHLIIGLRLSNAQYTNPYITNAYYTNAYYTKLYNTKLFNINVYYTNVYYTNTYNTKLFNTNVYYTNVCNTNTYHTNSLTAVGAVLAHGAYSCLLYVGPSIFNVWPCSPNAAQQTTASK